MNNTFENQVSLNRAQEMISRFNGELQNQTKQQVQYNHYTCNYGEIIVPKAVILSDNTITAIKIILDAYAYVYNYNIPVIMTGYTDENNLKFENFQLGLLLYIENGKLNILRK